MKAAALFLVLALAKMVQTADVPYPDSPWVPIAYLWQDAAIALGFLGLEYIFRFRPRVPAIAYAALVAYAIINVPIARILGTPLTASMVGATDGALLDSVAHYLTPGNASLVVVLVLAAFLAPRLAAKAGFRSSVLAACGLLVLLGPFAVSRTPTRGFHRSALVALAATAAPRWGWTGASHRTTTETLDRPSDFWRRSPVPGDEPIDLDLSEYRGSANERHVVLVILESTAPEFLAPWGAAEDPTPNLTRLATESLLFETTYAAYPESIKGLVALLGSRTPAIHTAAEHYASVSFPTLASVLGEQGYHTALVHSGRFDYLGMNAVIQNRGYDVLEDAGDVTGIRTSSFGAEERHTVRRMLEWTDALPADERFFLTYMPIAGHHPYDTPEPGPFPTDNELDVYRNAIHYGDQALGELLAGLEEQGHLEETLLVIVGDHGQAFHRHPGNYGHTFFLYDENIRVPFIIAAPGAIDGRRVLRVASHLDLAPTILDVLGLGSPDAFEGESLLDVGSPMALFFTDYSLTLLGLRDGRWKYVHEPDSGDDLLFDVARDPLEEHDVSHEHPERTAKYRAHVRGWMEACLMRR